MTKGLIFNIQRFSIHDGPGIRTTVFLKGCSLRCFWCHNPESFNPKPEIRLYPTKCIGCGECLKACPQQAHAIVEGEKVFRRDICLGCGKCAETCYSGAIELSGRRMTTEQVIAEVLQDRAFYVSSDGGVTLSGGEPLMQADFSLSVLTRCKQEGLHTAVETSGHCRWADLSRLMPVTDLIMMDIKHMDSHKHRASTGVTNERILQNAQRMAEMGKPIIFRVPVVPGVNDGPEEIGAIAEFVAELTKLARNAESCSPPPEPQITLELLPFHSLATDKYSSLGLEYRAAEQKSPSSKLMQELFEAARAYGISVTSKAPHSIEREKTTVESGEKSRA